MIPATALLNELLQLGIELKADGERLRFRPKAKVTPELYQRIMVHKPALLDLLRREVAGLHDVELHGRQHAEIGHEERQDHEAGDDLADDRLTEPQSDVDWLVRLYCRKTELEHDGILTGPDGRDWPIRATACRLIDCWDRLAESERPGWFAEVAAFHEVYTKTAVRWRAHNYRWPGVEHELTIAEFEAAMAAAGALQH